MAAPSPYYELKYTKIRLPTHLAKALVYSSLAHGLPRQAYLEVLLAEAILKYSPELSNWQDLQTSAGILTIPKTNWRTPEDVEKVIQSGESLKPPKPLSPKYQHLVDAYRGDDDPHIQRARKIQAENAAYNPTKDLEDENG